MKILITGGPTNEYIDEVMKITNMSKGSLSKSLANNLTTQIGRASCRERV